MANIIAGEVTTMEQGESVCSALRDAGFNAADLSVFMLNAPGQHAIHPVGGDEDADAGASNAHAGAVTGAVVGAAVGLGAGAAAMAATGLGPAVAATVSAVGAYTGSLVGALNKTGDEESPQPEAVVRHAGTMVAVNVSDEGSEQRAIDILRAHGAGQIERAQGNWADGKWLDFDPRATPDLIESPVNVSSGPAHRTSP